MIREIIRKNKLKKINSFVDPDEIMLDSKNLPGFDRQQFEGRIEKPISKQSIYLMGIFFSLLTLVFSVRLGNLQIKKGEAFLNRSENNVLERKIIFNDRGIIYDRNKKEIAWNETNEESSEISKRSYMSPGFSHTLGYVSYPMQDKDGNYWQSYFTGKDGLEKEYDSILKGQNGSKIVEIDARKKIHSENIVNPPVRGADLITTLDSRIQKELFNQIKSYTEKYSFNGGAGIIMDITNGEIISSVSFPEYDSETLSSGKDAKKVESYIKDKRQVFLDRTISGLYAPGSIVKPFFAIGALAEKIISPYKKILSTGSISIQNPYFKDQKTVFKDWKAHGWVDMREAIAVSSDVYFYAIGGGFEDQKGLGVANLEKYARLFGIGIKTGVDLPDEKSGLIPNPDWKMKVFKGEAWNLGNTYHTSIGQYGFQVTPMEMARSVSALANFGTLVTPHYILGDKSKEQKISTVDLPKEYFSIAQEGMRAGVTDGTSSILNVPFVKIASKTGTAELGINKNKINSWVVGFFPYENPKYSFTIIGEAGPAENTPGVTLIMRGLIDWMYYNAPEYFNSSKSQ